MDDVTDNVVTTAVSPPGKNVMAAETARVTCMVLPHELIFVDCGVMSRAASAFRSDMEDRFQRPTSHLLLTHTHWDHIFGMEAFKDVTVVASQTGVQYLKRNLKKTLKKEKREQTKRKFNKKEIEESYKNAELFVPHVSVKEELVVGSGADIIFHVIGGHSKDSACIYYPKERVLCTGDNLLTCYYQLPGSPVETLSMFRYWESLDIEWVIPGHGPVVRKEYIKKVRKYYENLISVLREFKAQNLPLKEVLGHPDLPVYFGKGLPTWIEGGIYHTTWLELNIKSWYRSISQ